MMILPPEAQTIYEEQLRKATMTQLAIAKTLERAANIQNTTIPFPIYLAQAFALTSNPELYSTLHELLIKANTR